MLGLSFCKIARLILLSISSNKLSSNKGCSSTFLFNREDEPPDWEPPVKDCIRLDPTPLRTVWNIWGSMDMNEPMPIRKRRGDTRVPNALRPMPICRLDAIISDAAIGTSLSSRCRLLQEAVPTINKINENKNFRYIFKISGKTRKKKVNVKQVLLL